eukprot:53153_1
MIMSEVFLLCLILLTATSGRECIFHFSDQTLDLSALSHVTITTSPTVDQAQIQFTPCRNGLLYNDTGLWTNISSGITQQNGSIIEPFILWKNTTSTHFAVSVSSYESNHRVWKFRYDLYKNTEKTFEIMWICNTNVEYQVNNSTTPVINQDYYALVIESKHACTSNINDSRASGGSILLIACLCALFLYCVGGWWFNAYRKGGTYSLQTFNDHVPHKNVWMKLPQYVWTGCKVTREYMMEVVNIIKYKKPKQSHANYEFMQEEQVI